MFPKDPHDFVGGVALSQPPQVDGLAGTQGDHGLGSVPVGIKGGRNGDLGTVYQGEKPVQLRLRGDAEAVLREAPGGNHRGHRDIEGPTGGGAVSGGPLQKGIGIPANLHSIPPGGVEAGDFAVLHGPGELGLQVPYNVLAGVGGGGGALPVGGDEHGGVHGDDLDALLGLVRAHLRAAAREDQDRQ